MSSDFKQDDSPLAKLRNFKPLMYPIKGENGDIVGYDYGIDVESVESVFPWFVQKDNFGRKFLNKDAMLYFLISCLLEQDRDVEILHKKVNKGPNLQNWNPDN